MRIKKSILAAGAAILLAVPITVSAAFQTYYNKMHIQDISDMAKSRTDSIEVTEDTEPEEPQGIDDRQNIEDAETAEYETYLKENLAAQSEDVFTGTENVYNILLIGTDERNEDDSGRSDSILIASINRDTKQIVLTSVMRDIYCAIPGHKDNRINAAYAYGGADLLMETVGQNFGIELSDYVSIDFFGFVDVIDALGGVEAEVTAEEIEMMNGYLVEINTLLGEDATDGSLDPANAGTLTLSGKQALAFSRIRYIGNSDFDRTGRQREILSSAFTKVKDCSLLDLLSVMDECLPCITTNISQGKVFSLLLSAMEYKDYELVSDRLPVDGSYEDLTMRGMAVLGVDFSVNREHWYETVYGGDWEIQ